MKILLALFICLHAHAQFNERTIVWKTPQGVQHIKLHHIDRGSYISKDHMKEATIFKIKTGQLHVAKDCNFGIASNPVYGMRSVYRFYCDGIYLDFVTEGGPLTITEDFHTVDVHIETGAVVGLNNVHNDAQNPLVHKTIHGKEYEVHPKRFYTNGNYSQVIPRCDNEVCDYNFIVQNRDVVAHSLELYPNGKIRQLYLSENANLKAVDGSEQTYCRFYTVNLDENELAVDGRTNDCW